MFKKGIICLILFLCGVTVFAQNVTTDHYRFANRFDMGLGRSITPLGDGRALTTTWDQIWTLYNTNKLPAIDIQTFFDTLIQEQNSSGRYQNDEDLDLRIYKLSIELNERRLIDYMDSNNQNIAVMSVADVPIADYTMIYKLDGTWHVLFFSRLINLP